MRRENRFAEACRTKEVKGATMKLCFGKTLISFLMLCFLLSILPMVAFASNDSATDEMVITVKADKTDETFARHFHEPYYRS